MVKIIDGSRIDIKKAESLDEVRKVQEMEYNYWGPNAVYPKHHPHHAGKKFSEVWKGEHGLAFSRYENLWAIFPEGIDIGVSADTGDIRGYNAYILINTFDIHKGMPNYNMEISKFHKADGNCLYVVNHTAPGLSDEMMEFMKKYASERSMSIATPTWTEIKPNNETHPYLVGEKGSNFWQKNGFVPIEDTRDSEWHPDGGPKAEMLVRIWSP